jgi:hypothetical protein
LNKTLNIINSKNKEKKEFLIITSKKKTPPKLIKKICRLNKKYKIKIYSQKKPLVGGAVKTGIYFSKMSHIVIMASDLETNPYDLKKMIKLSKMYPKNIVCASRWHEKGNIHGYGFFKKIFNYMFQQLIKILFNSDLRDFTFAYRIYPSKVLKDFKFIENNHSFALEMILKPIKLGYKISNVPTTWKPRIEGVSQNSFWYYYDYFKVLIKNTF